MVNSIFEDEIEKKHVTTETLTNFLASLIFPKSISMFKDIKIEPLNNKDIIH